MNQLFARAQVRWQQAGDSLWFIPAVMSLLVVVLSFLLLHVDRTYDKFIDENISWLFGGTAGAARVLLSTIAAAVITVASVSFSLTILAMQQASAQFTPRVLRTFTSNRGNQIVLGTYIATFVYSLLILRAVRGAEEGGEGFIPSIAASFAIVLALVCMGLLIYFINHIASSLQATTIIGRVHSDLLKQIDELYPQPVGKPAGQVNGQRRRKRSDNAIFVQSKTGGFITRIDERSLESIDFEGVDEVELVHKVGDFVSSGEVLAKVYGDKDIGSHFADEIREAIVIARERSTEQDVLFPVRQLVDTALKGLSPGINDVTTSEYCIRYLGDAAGLLAGRNFPETSRTLKDKDIVLTLIRLTWSDFFLGSFSQILHNAADKMQVLEVLLWTVRSVAEQLPSQERAEPIKDFLDDFEAAVAKQDHIDTDVRRLTGYVREIREILKQVPINRTMA